MLQWAMSLPSERGQGVNRTGEQPQHETTQPSTEETTFPQADKESSLKGEKF